MEAGGRKQTRRRRRIQSTMKKETGIEREREKESGQWMMVVGGNTHAALYQRPTVDFSVAYLYLFIFVL